MTEHDAFNAHHAPLGAFASFTLGHPGASGGFDLERAAPPCVPVYIGLERNNVVTAGATRFDLLPFTGDAVAADAVLRYAVSDDTPARAGTLATWPLAAVDREFSLAADRWRCGDLGFTLYSPVVGAPDLREAPLVAQRAALVPAVRAELVIDNRHGHKPRRAFIGIDGSDPCRGLRHLRSGTLVGVAQGGETAIVTEAPGAWSGIGFDAAGVLLESRAGNRDSFLGNTGLVVVEAPPGHVSRFRFALCFYRQGMVTTGLQARYWYTRLFDNIEAVARHALLNFDDAVVAAARDDARWRAAAGLNEHQRFLLAQAVHSYYGSTQLLEHDGQPLWVVNEGEYRMINTFDLQVDHLFFELAKHPWAVRDTLELYRRRYSYEDQVRLPGESVEHPGGLAFTHDMGVANNFAPAGRSSYERAGLNGCFSYMSHEQLLNWVLCAAAYAQSSGDDVWLLQQRATLQRCLASLQQRDHPEPALRDGLMGADSSRCDGGSEITTYDSLDASLGQARANSYLGGKTWAAHVLLQHLLQRLGDAEGAGQAAAQARLAAQTLCAHLQPDGALPAVLEPASPGWAARVIPVIEGLVYPWHAGCREALALDGPHAELLQVLRQHLQAVLKPGVCLFPDGGWKLSSTSGNSWLSKIFLCQHVARAILGLPWQAEGLAADAAHAGWLKDPANSRWAFSDQVDSGRVVGSRYYPRGVTAWLWLDERGLAGPPP